MCKMKQWIEPELLNLEIKYTSHGGTRDQKVDEHWVETVDGEDYDIYSHAKPPVS